MNGVGHGGDRKESVKIEHVMFSPLIGFTSLKSN